MSMPRWQPPEIPFGARYGPAPTLLRFYMTYIASLILQLKRRSCSWRFPRVHKKTAQRDRTTVRLLFLSDCRVRRGRHSYLSGALGRHLWRLSAASSHGLLLLLL